MGQLTVVTAELTRTRHSPPLESAIHQRHGRTLPKRFRVPPPARDPSAVSRSLNKFDQMALCIGLTAKAASRLENTMALLLVARTGGKPRFDEVMVARRSDIYRELRS